MCSPPNTTRLPIDWGKCGEIYFDLEGRVHFFCVGCSDRFTADNAFSFWEHTKKHITKDFELKKSEIQSLLNNNTNTSKTTDATKKASEIPSEVIIISDDENNVVTAN